MVSDIDSGRTDSPGLSAAREDAPLRPGREARTRRRGPSIPDLRQIGAALTAPLRSLTRRIVIVNIAGLAILVSSTLYLNKVRSEMIQVRVESLESQAEILATAIAEIAAVAPDEAGFDNYTANALLRQLTLDSGQRAQIYKSGRLTGDTRSFATALNKVETRVLPPLEGAGGILGWIEKLYSDGVRAYQRRDLPLYIETPTAGITEDAEVYRAQRGEPANAIRANSEGELIVSVAVPIRRLKIVSGVLVLSTEGGDIDRVLRVGRIEILRVFILASMVSLLLSVVLANGIARPIRRLSSAAEQAGMRQDRMVVSERVEIPDYTARGDEVGELSGAMRRMTAALYSRIDAIESFAADVAHEIKNPLTSLRSAVDTLHLAKTAESKERLLEVIRDDVDRMDRLVTDISNASRLDAELVREERAPFDLSALAETTVDIMQSDAEERGVRLITETPGFPLMVRGLESRVAQVISNIIGNGISFSPEGGKLSVKVTRDETGAAILIVEDQGPGIPADNLDSIFKRFYTERPSSESFGRHSGLGLAISKQIVEAHGGTIIAQNIGPAPGETDALEDTGLSKGTGARFIVRFPL